jgi:transcriptional repressor NrdR
MCDGLPGLATLRGANFQLLGLTPQDVGCYKRPAATDCGVSFMRCPKCGGQEDRVVDSRASREGATIRRRRECEGCGYRFTTYEQIEHEELMVLKRDGRREEFSKDKLLSGIKKACQKRPISSEAIEELLERVIRQATEKYEHEVPAEVIGRALMDELRKLDQVAYVRFASVYRRFQEATEFVQEVRKLEGAK